MVVSANLKTAVDSLAYYFFRILRLPQLFLDYAVKAKKGIALAIKVPFHSLELHPP